MVGVQSAKHLGLVAEVAQASPKGNARLVPCGGEYRVLAFGTIDREEIQRLMMGIVQTYRDDDMTHAQVGSLRE